MEATAVESWGLLEPRLRDAFGKAALFKADCVDAVIEKIRPSFTAIDDLRCFNAIKFGRELTSDEKKGFGLASRRKYSEGFISFVDVTRLDGRCPNALYQDTFMDATMRTRRVLELERMRRAGIKKVELLDPFSGAGCTAAARAAKVYAINDAPALPLPGCDQDYCRCSYIAQVQF